MLSPHLHLTVYLDNDDGKHAYIIERPAGITRQQCRDAAVFAQTILTEELHRRTPSEEPCTDAPTPSTSGL